MKKKKKCKILNLLKNEYKIVHSYIYTISFNLQKLIELIKENYINFLIIVKKEFHNFTFYTTKDIFDILNENEMNVKGDCIPQ